RRTRVRNDALEHSLAHHAGTAAQWRPSLRGKTITQHVLRHTAAMRLLHAGVDITVIALWLGHRVRRHFADLPASRPRPQAASPGQDHPTDQFAGPLPAA